MKTVFVFLAMLLVPVLMAACGSASGSTKFPTGRFVSSADANLEYEFREDNTWSYYLGGLMGAKGNYKVDGNLWIEEGTDECPFPGTYEWAYDGKNLTFKLQGDDACEPRREATDGQAFSLVK